MPEIDKEVRSPEQRLNYGPVMDKKTAAEYGVEWASAVVDGFVQPYEQDETDMIHILKENDGSFKIYVCDKDENIIDEHVSHTKAALLDYLRRR